MQDSKKQEFSRRDYLRWWHGAANTFYIVGMHAALIVWLWYGRDLLPYPYFLAVSILGALVHQRILSEWFHEAVHWNIVSNKKWSDRLANLLTGPFNGVRIKSARKKHFQHHRVESFFMGDDPDTCAAAVINKRELLLGLLRDVSGMTAIEAFLSVSANDASKSKESMFIGIFWLAYLLVIHGSLFYITVSAGYYDVYPIYFVTLISLYPIANRLRLYLQHATVRDDGTLLIVGSKVSRTYSGGLFSQIFIQSPMIMYHHEHHAFPALPYRALRAMVTARPSSDVNTHGKHPIKLLTKLITGF